MNSILSALLGPWPWYVVGPLIGLMVPALLLIGNKTFGLSSNLRHMCAIGLGNRLSYFRYDWRGAGAWNLAFAAGIVLGGFIAARFLVSGDAVSLAPATQSALASLGVHDVTSFMPRELFSWHSLASVRGALMLIVGGVLVGFGTSYGGGCTSGHAISGLANFQLPSLIATLGFFAGGLVATWVILPWLLGS